MQQTLLAVLALMIVATQILTQYRGAARVYNEIIDDELEVAAGAVALHVMEMIGHRSFDSSTLPDAIDENGLPAGSAALTSPSGFGVSGGCDLDEPFRDTVPCMDIDDVHMEQGTWQDVPFRLKDGGELPFDVRTEVFYVESGDLDQPLSGGQTSLHKKVAVTVRAQGAIHANRYPDGFVRLERVFSYSQDRARNRYFDAYPAGTALDELDSDE